MVLEDVAMNLIANSGQARSLAFQAAKAARNKEFEKANSLLTQAQQSANMAHEQQTELLINESRGEAIEITTLLMHAQDHLMTSLLALDLIKEIVYLHECKSDEVN